MVDPEGDPGQHDDEDGRQICLEDEVADVAMQDEAERQTLVGTCRRDTESNGRYCEASSGGELGVN